jgi:hypothetical protein
METLNFQHRQYKLQCSARVLDGGRFRPLLTITKQVWPTRPREIALDGESYLTEQEAVDAAQRQGMAWIENYG